MNIISRSSAGNEAAMKDLRNACGEFIHGLQADTEHYGPSRHFLPFLSLMIHGSRSILCFKLTEMMDFMKSKDAPQKDISKKKRGDLADAAVADGAAAAASSAPSMGYPTDEVSTFASFMSPFLWEVYLAGGYQVFASTIAPLEVLYMPPGYVTLEMVHSVDCIGLKRIGPIDPRKDLAGHAITKSMLSWAMSVGKDVTVLSAYTQLLDKLAKEAEEPSEHSKPLTEGQLPEERLPEHTEGDPAGVADATAVAATAAATKEAADLALAKEKKHQVD